MNSYNTYDDQDDYTTQQLKYLDTPELGDEEDEEYGEEDNYTEGYWGYTEGQENYQY